MQEIIKDNTMTFKEKSVYGATRIYPVSEAAIIITNSLLAKKTVSQYDLDVMKRLGFEVNLIKLP
jgi:hypothetical protein